MKRLLLVPILFFIFACDSDKPKSDEPDIEQISDAYWECLGQNIQCVRDRLEPVPSLSFESGVDEGLWQVPQHERTIQFRSGEMNEILAQLKPDGTLWINPEYSCRDIIKKILEGARNNER